MPDDIITTRELLAETGVVKSMLTAWSKEGLALAAKVSHGKWRREIALAWIADRRADSLKESALAMTPDEGTDWGSIAEQRTRLYKLQGDGQELRNGLLEANLVYRESAIAATAEAAQEQIAAGDAWARDASTPACKAILGTLTQAQALAAKLELWNELRSIQAETIRRVAGALASGEDVGPSRVRVPRSVGG